MFFGALLKMGIRLRHLRSGWVDKDRLLPHVIFEILCQFIEEEDPENSIDWQQDKKHAAAWTELNELYRWWTSEYVPFETDETYLDGIETPKLERRPVPGNRRLHLVEFRYSSPKAKAKAEAALRARRRLEERMEVELTRRCKRVINVRRFMWT